MIHSGDLMKITLKVPGRTLGSLEKVEKAGDVATPDGSFVKANGLTLAAFRTSLANLYADIPGYEEVRIEVCITSSPYSVIKYDPDRKTSVSISSTNTSGSVNAKIAPTIYPRNFETPITIWQAIQLEGGIPHEVDPHRIQVLKSNVDRKTFDCSGKEGLPDGTTAIESGDYLFLVPPETPISKIFD